MEISAGGARWVQAPGLAGLRGPGYGAAGRGRPHVRLDVWPLRPEGPTCVDAWVSERASAYDGLASEAATLTFIGGVDALLRGLADRFGRPHPGPLGHTRREKRWLEEGGEPPSPSTFLSKPLTDRRVPVPALPEEHFWRVMDALSGDGELRERRLRGQLRKLTLAQLAGFHARYVQMTMGVYTKPVWVAVEAVIGFASDDVFTDVRCWLVAQGRDTYDSVVRQPDRLRKVLANIDDEELASGEVLAAAAEEMYVDRCGRSMTSDYLGLGLHEPEGPPEGASIGVCENPPPGRGSSHTPTGLRSRADA